MLKKLIIGFTSIRSHSFVVVRVFSLHYMLISIFYTICVGSHSDMTLTSHGSCSFNQTVNQNYRSRKPINKQELLKQVQKKCKCKHIYLYFILNSSTFVLDIWSYTSLIYKDFSTTNGLIRIQLFSIFE